MTRRRTPGPPAPAGCRTGAALAVALICALLVSLMSAVLVRTALVQVERLTHDEHQLQAEWLAQSGLALAAQRLRADPEYVGETWLPPAVGGTGALGRVVIEIRSKDVEEATAMAMIHVTADVPDDPVERVRVERVSRLPAENPTSKTQDSDVVN